MDGNIGNDFNEQIKEGLEDQEGVGDNQVTDGTGVESADQTQDRLRGEGPGAQGDGPQEDDPITGRQGIDRPSAGAKSGAETEYDPNRANAAGMGEGAGHAPVPHEQDRTRDKVIELNPDETERTDADTGFDEIDNVRPGDAAADELGERSGYLGQDRTEDAPGGPLVDHTAFGEKLMQIAKLFVTQYSVNAFGCKAAIDKYMAEHHLAGSTLITENTNTNATAPVINVTVILDDEQHLFYVSLKRGDQNLVGEAVVLHDNTEGKDGVVVDKSGDPLHRYVDRPVTTSPGGPHEHPPYDR